MNGLYYLNIYEAIKVNEFKLTLSIHLSNKTHTDLSIQYRILYRLYDSFNRREQVTVAKLKQKEFEFLENNVYESELLYLAKATYLTISETGHLELSGLGIRTTEVLFKKFLQYIKKSHREELSYFINIFEYYNDQRKEQISQMYFRIQHEPEVEKAFFEYLEKIDRIENVERFEYYFDPRITVSLLFFHLA